MKAGCMFGEGGRRMIRAPLVLWRPRRLSNFGRIDSEAAGRHLSFAISILCLVVIALSALYLASFF